SAVSCRAWRRRRDHARYRTPSATRSFRTPAARVARAVGWSGRSLRYRKNPGRLSPCTASPRVYVRDDRTAKQPTSQTTNSGIKVVRERHKNVRLARQVPLSGKKMHGDSIGLQHAPDFREVLVRISCVLQHAGAQHDVEEVVLEREPIWSSA